MFAVTWHSPLKWIECMANLMDSTVLSEGCIFEIRGKLGLNIIINPKGIKPLWF